MMSTSSPVATGGDRRSGRSQSRDGRHALFQARAIVSGQLHLMGAAGTACRLDPCRSGNWHDEFAEIQEPGNRDVLGRHAMPARHLGEHRIRLQLTLLLDAAKRPVSDQLNAMLDAELHDAAQQLAIVEHVQLDLDGVDLDNPARQLDLPAADVAQADPIDGAGAFERRQRADTGGERRAWIGRVQLIEVDALDPERAAAGLARRRQMAGAAVGHPLPARTRQSAFRGDDDAGAIAGPGG